MLELLPGGRYLTIGRDRFYGTARAGSVPGIRFESLPGNSFCGRAPK